MSECGDIRKKILIVDDEKNIRDSLRLILKNNFNIETAVDGEECLSKVNSTSPDIILLDVMMPKLDGIDTLRALRDQQSKIPVIMLTASSTVKDAVEAMKLGAVDYLNKPFDVSELTDLIINTLSVPADSKTETEHSIQGEPPQSVSDSIIGDSQLMQNVFQKVKQVAVRDTTVLITGESGTGKELIARQIHEQSPRKSAPFIAINCAAIPETLIESELFGHEKGAFTSAVEQHIGYFELADNGTIFLDEIGELNLTVQVKLLRFLQEREFYRIGRTKPIKVNVRIVAATNKRLEELTKEKKFREDLYYRINVINIELPPLRDRFEDIPLLIDAFMAKYANTYGNRQLSFDSAAMNRLIEYPWPGNVRELENVVESLLALAPHDQIREDDLPPKLKVPHTLKENNPHIFEGSLNFQDAERTFETEIILKALKKTNWVQTRAADLLGISRRILKYKMDKLGITEEPLPSGS
ncbi:MAG: sigma-54-dependent transcriptional regulator [Bdellovibrionota bacterium]|jgi:DNA-binding NtrC family response regulator